MLEKLEQLYHFLFETFEGIIILVIGGIVISALVSLILEIKSKRISSKKSVVEVEDRDN